MSSTPTASRNDAAGTTINNPHQQQQGPLQQRPLLSPPSTPGSSHLRHYNHQQVIDSSSISTPSNQSIDITMNTSKGTYGSNNVHINGYMNNGGESTIDRQRSTPTQQQTVATSQMSPSPYRMSGGPSYNNHSLYSNGSSTDVAVSNTSSTMVPSSPLPQQQKKFPVCQPIPSPQQMLQIQNHQMKLQEQVHRQNHHHYQQQYQNTSNQTTLFNGSTNISSIHTQSLQTDSRTTALPQHAQTSNSNSNYQKIESNYVDSNTMNQMSSPIIIKGQYQAQILSNKNNSAIANNNQVASNMGAMITAQTLTAVTNSPTKLGTVEAAVPNNTSSNKNTSSNNNNLSGVSNTTLIQQLPPEKVTALLSRCTWVDKTIWASRQLLGGQAVNGFMRATATVQRIKKQRARQNVKSGKSKVNSSNSSNANASLENSGDSVKASGITPTASVTPSLEEQQAEEEIIKHEIMNARTAKKIKQELEGGIQFCVLLHDTIRSIIQQVDPSIPPIEPLSSSSFASRATTHLTTGTITSILPLTSSVAMPIQNGSASGTKLNTSQKPSSTKVISGSTAARTKSPNHPPPQSPMSESHGTVSSASSHMSPSNATGSTLRRHRRTKIPPSGEVLIHLPEVDELTGKKHSSKKGNPHRLSDVIRFRALRQGDPVAARVTSRDLWILARVVKDYPGTNFSPIEFLRLSDSRREQLFKEKVLIQDVEEHDGGAAAAVFVSRSLVLPLPRSVSEAAEWGNFYRFFKKGSRVYAMYPQTTALYTATVVDCTTYCRRDEDIIVVEFDGDDPDPITGKLPACHIPARFVTLIPKEFPGSHAPSGTGTSGSHSIATVSNSKRKRNSPIITSEDADIMNGVLDDLNFDGDLPGLDQFDDLDFDLLGDG
jgi:hypothetical protein